MTPVPGRRPSPDAGTWPSPDTGKVADEERLDGKYPLCTADPALPAAEVALGYKNPLEAERAFRDMKSTLALRPVYHR